MLQLIPQWKLWWKRWSTWLLSALPILTAAREFLPQLQEYIPLDIYKLAVVSLSVLVFVALQIRQQSVSGAAP